MDRIFDNDEQPEFMASIPTMESLVSQWRKEFFPLRHMFHMPVGSKGEGSSGPSMGLWLQGLPRLHFTCAYDHWKQAAARALL